MSRTITAPPLSEWEDDEGRIVIGETNKRGACIAAEARVAIDVRRAR